MRVALLNNPHLKAISPWSRARTIISTGSIPPAAPLSWAPAALVFTDMTPAGVSRAKFNDYILHLRCVPPIRPPRTNAEPVSDGPESSDVRFFLEGHQCSGQDRPSSRAVFAVGGWYDNFVESDLNAFTALHNAAGKTDDKHRIMIGPWAHNMSIPFSGIDLGLDSSAPIRAYQIEWFDHAEGHAGKCGALLAGDVA